MAQKFDKYAYLKALHGADITPTQFRVLVTTLDYANQDGERAFPGIEKLAADCCMSCSTVQRSLKALCEAGWLNQVSRGGRAGDGRKWASEYAFPDSLSTCHLRLIEGESQPVKSTMSTGQIEDVNRSNHEPQPVTCDHPTDHVSTDHKTTDHEASAPLIATSEMRCYECGMHITGEPHLNRSTGNLYCDACPPF